MMVSLSEAVHNSDVRADVPLDPTWKTGRPEPSWDVIALVTGLHPKCLLHGFTIFQRHSFPEFGKRCAVVMWGFLELGIPPKSSILMGFSMMNHPFGGSPFMKTNPHVCQPEIPS